MTGDFEYDFEGGFFDKLRGGGRYSDNSIDLRGTWHGVCVTSLGADPNCSAPAGTPLVPLSAPPAAVDEGPVQGLVRRQHGQGRPALSGLPRRRRRLGPRPRRCTPCWARRRSDNFTPGDLNSRTEKTYTGWAVADYDTEIGGVAIDGGVRPMRVIKTQATSTGTQFNAGRHLEGDRRRQQLHTRVLPSFNLRAKLTDTLQARLAYSKGLARPNFDQLSTNLTLNNPNQVNPVTGHPRRQLGQPGPAPDRVRQLRRHGRVVLLQHRLADGGRLLTRKVDGFLAGGTVTSTYNGVVYDVGTVVNSGKGTVKGVEVGYQQFFDFLPGLLSGLGVQANLHLMSTAASATRSPRRAPASRPRCRSRSCPRTATTSSACTRRARSAPACRLQLALGLSGPRRRAASANGIPQYAKPYASLDASISYDVNDHVAVSSDAVNINNRMNVLYIGTPAAPLQYQLNDRRYGFAVRVTY
ncbi:hypothetical protein ACRAWD_09585 [Caulobacter segnis]